MIAALDIEKFAKVQALAQGGATEGERSAAQARMAAMANRAGLSLDEAIRRSGPTGNPDPAAEAAAAVRRQWESLRANPRSAKRRSRLVDEHGSEEAAKEAVFADTVEEAAIRAAVEPFRVKRPTTGWARGSLMGWDGLIKNLAPSIVDAIRTAVPIPATVRATFAEHQGWRDLGDNRCSIDPWYEDPDFIRARMALLEAALDRLPATSPDDVTARLDWMEAVWSGDVYRDVHEDMAWLATLRADVIRMTETVHSGRTEAPAEGTPSERAPPVQSGHLTATDRRAIVLSILDDPEGVGLSDREIARRVGVSPTTVGKLRRTTR